MQLFGKPLELATDDIVVAQSKISTVTTTALTLKERSYAKSGDELVSDMAERTVSTDLDFLNETMSTFLCCIELAFYIKSHASKELLSKGMSIPVSMIPNNSASQIIAAVGPGKIKISAYLDYIIDLLETGINVLSVSRFELINQHKHNNHIDIIMIDNILMALQKFDLLLFTIISDNSLFKFRKYSEKTTKTPLILDTVEASLTESIKQLAEDMRVAKDPAIKEQLRVSRSKEIKELQAHQTHRETIENSKATRREKLLGTILKSGAGVGLVGGGAVACFLGHPDYGASMVGAGLAALGVNAYQYLKGLLSGGNDGNTSGDDSGGAATQNDVGGIQ